MRITNAEQNFPATGKFSPENFEAISSFDTYLYIENFFKNDESVIVFFSAWL